MLCFRDYGQFDLAQLRTRGPGVVAPNLHVRPDGTIAYFVTSVGCRWRVAAPGRKLRVARLRSRALCRQARSPRRELRSLALRPRSTDELRALFESADLEVVELRYATVENTNRRRGVVMRRVWVHAVCTRRVPTTI